MLCILDGWGLRDETEANAVKIGRTPNFDRIWQQCPHTQLIAHGADVGLPAGVMGNSEVGHLNIGAGRIVWQDSSLIDREIETGDFFHNETIRAVMRHAVESNTRLHLIGLVSDGNVHASEGHYFALLEMAAREGLRADQVLLHAFTDGRDTPPRSAPDYIGRLLAQMVKTGVGAVASVIGRYYAMDRDNRWERVQKAYDCLTQGSGRRAPDALAAVQEAYERGETDEFIEPTVVLGKDGQPRPRIGDNDAVFFFNYRSDRGRELSSVFVDADFDAPLRETSHQPGAQEANNPPVVTKFRREVWPRTQFATMTRYSKDLHAPIAFEPRPQRNGLGETAANAGKTQLRIAETEKYPHVTYFFSGGIEEPWHGEERILVPSPKVATYDLQPEMSAAQVIAKVTEAIRARRFDLIILNFANPDMVGHTGVLEAAVKAVETVDNGLGQIIAALHETNGVLLVIADHGNCELMVDPVSGEPHTAHTTNPVPCILVGEGCKKAKLRDGGRLADVAPTLLDLMGLEPSAEMTGRSLLQSGAGAGAKQEFSAAPGALAVALEDVAERTRANLRFYAMAAAAQSQWRALFHDEAQQQARRLQDLERQLHGVYGEQEASTLPQAGDPNPETDEPPAIRGGQQQGDEMHDADDLPAEEFIHPDRAPNTEISDAELLAAAARLERDNVAHAEDAEVASDEPIRFLWSEAADAARLREGRLATANA
jgi:2,3-bisphosphoglycerate-independent phosphoglycerate mutase